MKTFMAAINTGERTALFKIRLKNVDLTDCIEKAEENLSSRVTESEKRDNAPITESKKS